MKYFVALTACLFACIGCSNSEHAVVPVSGRVTLNEKPLSNATIYTQPIAATGELNAGPGSAALTNENGEFELELQTEDTKGAIAGDVKLRIVENGAKRAATDDRSVAFKRSVPSDYYEGVTYTIPAEGTDAMNIDLETKKRR